MGGARRAGGLNNRLVGRPGQLKQRLTTVQVAGLGEARGGLHGRVTHGSRAWGGAWLLGAVAWGRGPF